MGTDYPYRPWALKTEGFPLPAAQSWAPSVLDQGLEKHSPWSGKGVFQKTKKLLEALCSLQLVTL